jgi:multidrug efflux pump subunit AcrB
VATLQEGKEQIPVLTRLRMNERARLSDIENLYVYSSQGRRRCRSARSLRSAYQMQTEKIMRRNQFRTITVSCFPTPGVLPSEIMAAVRPALNGFAEKLPVGYKMEIGGEEEEQVKGFQQMAVVMMISVVLIYLALVWVWRAWLG